MECHNNVNMHNTNCEMISLIIICIIWHYVAKVQGAHQGDHAIVLLNNEFLWVKMHELGLSLLDDAMKIQSKFCYYNLPCLIVWPNQYMKYYSLILTTSTSNFVLSTSWIGGGGGTTQSKMDVGAQGYSKETWNIWWSYICKGRYKKMKYYWLG